MHDFTQKYYDTIMDYVGLNQRSAGLMSTTPYTGFVRWHNRNHDVYDKFNKCLTKYIANMYGEYATPKMVETYNYTLTGGLTGHLKAWYDATEHIKKVTKMLYDEACEASDFVLADKFKHINKTAVNECFSLRRLMQRLEKSDETDRMIVNKIIHDWFEEHPDCEEIDLSL